MTDGSPDRRRRAFAALLFALLLSAAAPAAGWATAALGGSVLLQVAPPAIAAQPALLVFSSVERLLNGDLANTVTVAQVRADLAAYPADWPVVGVGTTNWADRNGELMPDGTAGAPRFWWADPDVQPVGTVQDLGAPGVAPVVGEEARFPFIALSAGDPTKARTWTLQNVDDVYAWLEQRLGEEGVSLAGLQLQGTFGPVKTTVAYHIHSAEEGDSDTPIEQHSVDYGPASWTFNGLFAADTAMQAVVSVPGAPLHFHGYQPASMVGGHIASAAAVNVTATVWPLDAVHTATRGAAVLADVLR